MTDYPHEPPSASSATPAGVQGLRAGVHLGVRVENDPLGPVNKIVRLMRGQRRLKSVLWPVSPGADVRLVRDAGTPRVTIWAANWTPIDELPIARRLAHRGRRAPRSCRSPTPRSPRPPPCAARSPGAREPSGDCAVVLRRRGSRRRAAGVPPRG